MFNDGFSQQPVSSWLFSSQEQQRVQIALHKCGATLVWVALAEQAKIDHGGMEMSSVKGFFFKKRSVTVM